ncbi:MAG: 50S ribosomal protein L28 [Candidatus Magasanikbacteria bacterium]
MSRTCTICGKKAIRANRVSHSNIKTPRRQKPNLQFLTINGKRLRACSTCRRTNAKKSA